MTEQSTAPAPRRRGRRWRLVGLGFGLFLVPMTVNAVENTAGRLPAWAVIGMFTAFFVCYALVAVIARHGLRSAYAGLAFLFALAAAIAVATGPESIWLVMYPLNMAPFLLPLRVAVISDAVAVAAVILLVGAADGTQAATSAAVPFLSFAVVTVLMGRMVRVNAELREAHERIAALASSEERARIARDLHDVLGHTLTTITVKAGLARRLLETGTADKAVAEVTDLENLARRTLGEVRTTLSGYRQANLSAELAASRSALAAAGITAELPTAVDDVPEPQRTAFAHVLREGVTNVIRHSRATHCRVRIGPSTVEIHDDGRGGSPSGEFGTGLAGLSERLAAVGAVLTAGPGPDGGFTLTASVQR